MYEVMNVHLENGLKVILHNVPGTRTVGCGLWIRQGSKYENNETSGLSHLLEHLVITAQNEDVENNLLDEISSQGIIYNATTTKEYTSYYMSGISSNTDLMISTLSKLVIDFDEISDKVFHNEKKVVEREALSYYSSFKQIMERSSQALWGNTGIGRVIVGDTDTIKNISKEKVKEIYNERYTPENSSLVIVGDINYKKVLELIEAYFIRWKDRKTVKIQEATNKNPGIYLNIQEGGQNSVISISFRTPGFDSPNRNSIEILSLVLGDPGLKSRLAREIRVKRGLAYVINSFENFYEDRGIIGFTAVCAHSVVNQVAELIIAEIKKCINEGFTKAEVKAAKNKLITKRVLGLESVADHLKFLGKAACYNENFSLEQELRNINEIEIEDINYVAKEVLVESNMGLAAIGDIDIDRLVEVAKLD